VGAGRRGAGGRAPRQNRALYDTLRHGALQPAVARGRDGALDLYDGVLRARDADGAIIFDGVEAKDYGD
jgi:NAD-reducing hydrogenase large subunit